MLRLGPFTLARHLADGGMGTVWLARDPLGAEVAIKLLRSRVATTERLAWALENEVRAAAALDHPNIAAVLDVGRVDAAASVASEGAFAVGAPWFAMEYAAGGTLHGLAGQALPWDTLQQVALALLDALGHAHARGVVHRDLKPANVLIAEGATLAERLRLADFGIAHGLARDGLPLAADTIVGTPAYMPPEQRSGSWRDQGPWTDLYALGVMVCEWVWGGRGGRDQDLDPWILLARPLPPGLPPGLVPWLGALLDPDPRARPRRAADAAHALRDLSGAALDLPMPALHSPPTVPLRRLPTPATPFQTWAETAATDLHLLAPPEPAGARARAVQLPSPPCPEDWRGGRRPFTRGHGRPALIGLRSLPVIGREPERDALWSTFREVVDSGRAGAVVLRGPAGAGKSRLAAWLGERAHEVGAAEVLLARHSAELGPQEGLLGMVRRALQATELDGEALLDRVGAAATWRPEETEALAAMLQRSNSPDRPAPSRREDRFNLLMGALRWLRHGRVAVVWLDDVQWSEEAIGLVRQALAASEVSPLPALFVLTAADEALAERPVEAAALSALLALPTARAIAVRPLDAEEGLALVRSLLPLTPMLARLVIDRTAGNPLFTVQLLGDWVQRGLVVEREDGFALRAELDLALPATLHEVWALRVAALLEGRPEAEARALAAAAALGVEVDAGEWLRLCAALGLPDPSALVPRLIARQLALQEAGASGWSFAHPLLREAVLLHCSMTLPEVHRAAAAMLLDQPAAPLRVERVARHLLQAGEREAALPHLRVAIEERFRRGEAAIVEHLVARYERLLDELGDAPDGPRRVWGWLILAQAIAQTRSLELSRALYERAEAVAATHGLRRDVLRARISRVTGTLSQGHPEQALALAEAALADASAWGEREQEPWARQALAACHLMAGRLGLARALMAEALAGFEALGALDGQMRCHRELAQCCQSMHDPAAAARHLDAYEALGERTGNLSSRMSALILRGELLREAGELEAAAACYAEALVRYEALGSRSTAVTGTNLALVRIAQGRFAEAAALCEAAIRRAQRSHHQTGEFCAQVTLLVPLAAEADREALRARLAVVGPVARRVPLAHPDLLDCLSRAAGLAEARGWPEEAAELAELSSIYARFLDEAARRRDASAATTAPSG